MGIRDTLGRKLRRRNPSDRLRGAETRPMAQPSAEPTETMETSAEAIAGEPAPVGAAAATGDMGTTSNAGTTEQGAYRPESAQPAATPTPAEPGPSSVPYADRPAEDGPLVTGSGPAATFASETGLDGPDTQTAQGSDSLAGKPLAGEPTPGEPPAEPPAEERP